jgi:hypothetical protein
MSVRCKFKVDSIKRESTHNAKRDAAGSPIKDERGNYVYEKGESWSVTMSPVYGNGDPSHENTKFWAASPSGQFTLNTVNKAAVDLLELGGEYYLDITPAPEAK